MSADQTTHNASSAGALSRDRQGGEADVARKEWRGIDSAPKDGTDILVYCRDTGEQFAAYWAGAWVYAITRSDQRIVCEPTDWHPLPNPPGDA